MDHGSFAGNVSIGTYNIDNNKIENFDSIINLKDNEGFTNKDLVLKEDVKTYLDTLYYSEDFFGVYCGRK